MNGASSYLEDLLSFHINQKLFNLSPLFSTTYFSLISLLLSSKLQVFCDSSRLKLPLDLRGWTCVNCSPTRVVSSPLLSYAVGDAKRCPRICRITQSQQY